MSKLYVALVTPFLQNKEIDYKSLVNLIEKMVMDKVNGIILAGTTGEGSALTFNEKEELLRFCLSIVNQRIEVWMSVGSNNTLETIECAKMAQNYPIDGIMVITPYYNRPSQRGLYAHFKSVAEAVSCPIMIYNVPKRTGIEIEAQTVIDLWRDFPNIVALKQASKNDVETEKILAQSHCLVYSGEDGALLESLRIGMDGLVSVVGHLYSGLILEIMHQFELGIEEKQLDQQLKQITQASFLISSPSDIKYLLSKSGWCLDEVRLPLVSLNDEEKQQIQTLIERI